LNSTGIPKPLARINRVPKHDTTQIIPSDGFNEKQTTNKNDIQHPANHHMKEKKILSMIHRYNLADLNLTERTLNQPNNTGFKKITEPKFEHDWVTSTTNFFGKTEKLGVAGEQ